MNSPVDVLIIGAGASGAAVAWSLADTQMHILCLEQGGWMNPATYPSTGRDWEARAFGDYSPSPNIRARPEDYPINDDASPIKVVNFNGVGGGTVMYTAHFPRLHPSDFRVRSLDGVADDWPVDYDILVPFFEEDISDRIAVYPVTGIGYELYTTAFGQPNIAPPTLIEALLRQAATEVQGHRFSPRFLIGEWREVVDAWQLASWEDYRDVARLGRKTRIGGKQREILWSIFELVRAGLEERKAVTWPGLFNRVTAHMVGNKSAFDFVVVDEAQDVGVAELRFLASLAANRADGLFFAGDLGQRIFQQPFSWRSLGVDVRGRSYTLRINYRTSHQIRVQADRLLPPTLADVDGNAEDRRGTVSVFNGPAPTIATFDDPEQEAEAVGAWITGRVEDGIEPHEIGVFVRSNRELRRARNAVKQAGVSAVELSDKIEVTPGKLSIGTMHLAKGLEFRAIAVMACDDEVIPLQERIENVADDADLEEVYNSERHLLYVACTRARDHLLVTGVKPASEFLDDLATATVKPVRPDRPRDQQ